MENQATFFQVFAAIVQHSGLSYPDVARHTNERAQGTIFGSCPPVNRQTISRIYRGIDLPQPLLLYRIARFGLEQTEAQCKKLEQLRQKEKETHTTSHHTATKTKVPDTDELPPLPTRLQQIKQA